MRPVHLTDLDLATRVVCGRPDGEQVAIAAKIVAGARIADKFRKRLRRRHPIWGDGTLAAAALSRGTLAASTRCDTAYQRALIAVLRALANTEGFDYPRQALYCTNRNAARNVSDGLYSGKPS